MLSEHADIEDKARGFDAGADEYIGIPFDPMEFTLRIKAQLRRMDMMQTNVTESRGKVIAVHSIRGGVGCSSIAVNTAVRRYTFTYGSNPTVLVDMCLPVGVCDIVLKVHGARTIGDLGVFRARANRSRYVLEDILTTHESGLNLISGNRYPSEAELLTDAHIRRMIELLKLNYNYIVLDMPHDFSTHALVGLEEADAIIVPMSPDIVSVRNMQATFRVFDALGFDEGKLVSPCE